eukprot:3985771-Amphidinium_carterae.1
MKKTNPKTRNTQTSLQLCNPTSHVFTRAKFETPSSVTRVIIDTLGSFLGPSPLPHPPIRIWHGVEQEWRKVAPNVNRWTSYRKSTCFTGFRESITESYISSQAHSGMHERNHGVENG